MVILYPSYDINELKGSVNSGSPFISVLSAQLPRLERFNANCTDDAFCGKTLV